MGVASNWGMPYGSHPGAQPTCKSDGPISCQPCEGAPCVLVFADSAGIAGSALRVAWIIDQIGRL